MKKIQLFLAMTALMLVSCGGGDEASEEGGEKKGTCKEENSISIEGAPELSNFEMKGTVAFLSGWQFGSRIRTKAAVCFANYDVELSSFDVKMPKEDGQYIVMISFVGEFAPKEEKLKPVTTGKYDYKSSGDDGVGVSAIVWKKGGTAEGFKMISSQDIDAEITHIDESTICGHANIKTPEGIKINTTFNMPIEKDFWEQQR